VSGTFADRNADSSGLAPWTDTVPESNSDRHAVSIADPESEPNASDGPTHSFEHRLAAVLQANSEPFPDAYAVAGSER